MSWARTIALLSLGSVAGIAFVLSCGGGSSTEAQSGDPCGAAGTWSITCSTGTCSQVALTITVPADSAQNGGPVTTSAVGSSYVGVGDFEPATCVAVVHFTTQTACGEYGNYSEGTARYLIRSGQLTGARLAQCIPSGCGQPQLGWSCSGTKQ
jgi:hypothetical protein